MSIRRIRRCVIPSALLVWFLLFCTPAPPQYLEIGSTPVAMTCRR
jgi:hypothetical protein